MKCVECGFDAKKKDREANAGRCPNCKHVFVADPVADGLTDMQLKNAEIAVSGNGMFYFSREQLEYQLHRKFRKKQRWSAIAAIVFFLLFIVMLILAISKGDFFIALTVITGIGWLVAFGMYSTYQNIFARLHSVVPRWTVINPHSKLIKDKKYHFNSDNSHLEDISFDRVLICDKDETVNFFLENLFHFHYSCPVLGGNGYPQGMYEDMLQRLKRNPNLKVFLLHDYSPQGLSFVYKMKTDRNWFGDGKHYHIIDLGLNLGQKKKLFKGMTNKQKSPTGRVLETAEITLFKPAFLITLCGAAINEAVALDQVRFLDAATQHNDGYG